MNRKLSLGAIASASVALGSLLAAPSAQASCQLNNLAGCTITTGDKVIKDITLIGFTPISGQTLDFSIASGAWVVSTNFAPGQALTADKSFTLAYTIEITDPTKTFNKVQIQGDDTTINGGNTSQVVTLNGVSASPITSSDGTSQGPFNFNPGVTTINVSSVMTTSGGASFNNVSQKFTQQTPLTTSVPAPMPILGAGLAFSMSRRLRQRISLAM